MSGRKVQVCEWEDGEFEGERVSKEVERQKRDKEIKIINDSCAVIQVTCTCTPCMYIYYPTTCTSPLTW